MRSKSHDTNSVVVENNKFGGGKSAVHDFSMKSAEAFLIDEIRLGFLAIYFPAPDRRHQLVKEIKYLAFFPGKKGKPLLKQIYPRFQHFLCKLYYY